MNHVHLHVLDGRCPDPERRNYVPNRAPMRRRMLRLRHRRCRRAVREVFVNVRGGIITRRIKPMRPAWRTGMRPLALCAESRCRMHLAEMANPYGHELQVACAVVVANRGAHLQGDVGDLVGAPERTIGNIEKVALSKLGETGVVERPPVVADLERRVRACLLRNGESGLKQLRTRCHADDLTIVAVLDGMIASGAVAVRWGARNVGRRWSMVKERKEAA